MGGNPCRFKIIMNGDTIQSELRSLCYQIQEENTAPLSDEASYKIVEYLNHAEDLVFKAKRIFLESQGFVGSEEQGGWPHSLNFKK